MTIYRRIVPLFLVLQCAAGVGAQDVAIPDYSNSQRDQVPAAFRWRVEDIYPSEDAWRADLVRAKEDLEGLSGKLAGWTSNATSMAEFLEHYEQVSRRNIKLGLWASLHHKTQLTNAKYLDCQSSARDLSVDLKTRLAPMDDDVIRLGSEHWKAYLRAEPRLVPYRRLVEEILRKKDHVLSEEAEQVAAKMEMFTNGPKMAAGFLLNVDMPTPTAELPDGSRITLDRNRRVQLLGSRDSKEREAARRAAMGNLGRFANTFAALLDMSVKQDVASARIRSFPDCLSAELHKYDVDPAIYRNLFQGVKNNLGPYHRYLRLRRRILGLEKLHDYDAFLPVVQDVPLRFTFEQARELIEDSTTPLGADYSNSLKRAFDQRWMDVYSHRDKAGLGSAIAGPGVHPYVLLNYRGDFFDLLTVTHELGHAMGFYLAEQAQPFAAAQTSWFLSEVPSTLNEILLMEHLTDLPGDDRYRLAVLSEFVDRLNVLLIHSARGAEFELAIHEHVENGGTLSAEWLGALQLRLARYYAGHDQEAMIVDEYAKNGWIHSNIFFAPFQSYFYVVGAVTSLAWLDRMQRDSDLEAKKYMEFLQAGSSRSATTLLREADLDLSTTEPVLRALETYNRLVDEMEVIHERLQTRTR